MAIITLNNNSLSSVTALPAGISTGKVLQVATFVPTSIFSTTSTSLVDTGYSVTITPTATNSKMIVEFSGNWGKEGGVGRSQIEIQTNSSGSFSALKTSSYAPWSEDAEQASSDIIRAVESPIGTTNAVTYKLKVRVITSGQTLYVPINTNDASLCTVYEIAG
jgi:hypothetical protein